MKQSLEWPLSQNLQAARLKSEPLCDWIFCHLIYGETLKNQLLSATSRGQGSPTISSPPHWWPLWTWRKVGALPALSELCAIQGSFPRHRPYLCNHREGDEEALGTPLAKGFWGQAILDPWPL